MSIQSRLVMIIPGTLVSMIVVTVLLFNVSAGFSFPTSAAAAAPEASESLNLTSNASGSDLQAQLADNVSCKVSQRFPEAILQWCDWITHYSELRGLAPDLVAALIWQESGGNHLAYSNSGAVGLMQVMPSDGLAASFNCVNGPCFASRPTMQELEDPEFNIAYGTKYLSQQIARHGNLREGLKAYGPMNVGFYYADKVIGIYESHRPQD